MGLRTKFLISLVIVSAGLTMAALLVVQRSVRRHVREELVQSLQNSAVTFQDLQRRRAAEARRTAELVANVPALKAMMTTGDPATIQDASADIWRMASAGAGASTDLLALAGVTGKLMALHAAEPQVPRDSVQTLFAQSLSPLRLRGWWYVGGHLYEVFLQPIYTGASAEANSLGALAIGYEVDTRLAQEVSRISAGEVAFRYRDAIIVSTLSRDQTRDLQHASFGPVTANGAQELRLGGETFYAASVQLSFDPDAPVQVLMLKSYDKATVFLSSLNRLIILIAFAAVLLGSLFVFLISHTFTRPLADLVTGVRALEKGDFSYPLRIAGNDEVTVLTRTFDKMRHTLQESQSRMVNAARMEAVGQLAGGVAHDFNNLVTIIKGYTDLLLLQIKPDDPIAAYASQIKKAGDRATSVTRQLLAFSRKQVVQPEIVDPNALAVSLNKMLRILIGEDIEVKILSEAGLQRIFMDPGQFEQVLLNLAVNARDAMPKGGRLTIETTNVNLEANTIPREAAEAKPGPYIKLSVTDTGCGMSPEVLEKIFQPFFTTKEAGKGTGLGLAIVYGIVRQSGGFVRVRSAVGVGSTFEVFFPATRQATPVTRAEAPAEKPAAAVVGTILVVEDEDALRALARESLKMQGYVVLEAANGMEAIEVFRRHQGKFDLVVTDVVMPQLGGLELVDRLRQIQPGLPVLFISGYSDRVEEIAKSNINLLPKPFTPEQLQRAVRDTLAGKHTARATAAP